MSALQNGDIVQVLRGAYAGHYGTFRGSARGRAKVTLQAAFTRITVAPGDIRRAENAPRFRERCHEEPKRA